MRQGAAVAGGRISGWKWIPWPPIPDSFPPLLAAESCPTPPPWLGWI